MVWWVKIKMGKFKVGDIVRFKRNSRNAGYFKKGLENLEIRDARENNCTIWESDKSNCWEVGNDEIEHMINLTKTQRDKMIKKIKKEIKDNKEFSKCFNDINEVNEWSDHKLSNWK